MTATDAAGNASVQTLEYTIYEFDDMNRALIEGRAPEAGSTIPLRFRLLDENGDVTNAAATLAIDGVPMEAGEFARRGSAYQYNLQTQGFSPGRYVLQVQISLDGVNFPSRSILLQLR